MFVRSGAPITGKIVPAFGRKENSRDKATTENKMGFWTRKVNAQIFNSPLDFTSATGTPIYLQFSIISEFNCPLPLRSHRITISRPDEDIFFHWVYECTYFSFQTLQAEMRWNLLGEDANDAAFSQFGDMMKEYISNCAIYPDRFICQIYIDTSLCTSCVKFSEIVHSYRKTDLIELQFSPASWEIVKRDISKNYSNLDKIRKEAYNQLANAIQIVSEYQPAILVRFGMEKRVPEAYQPRNYKDMFRNIMLGNQYLPTFTPEERSKNLKQLVVEMEQNVLDNPVCTKVIPVNLTYADKNLKLTKLLTFTFRALGPKESPESYTITITDQENIFFDFTSIEINKQRFSQLISSLDIVTQESNPNSRSVLSKSKAIFEPQVRRQHTKIHQTVGFNHWEGIGGVIGVIAEDYMSGVSEQPDRYQAELELKHQSPANPFKDPISFEKSQENPLNGKLMFTERVGHKMQHSSPIFFKETSKILIKSRIQYHLNEVRAQLNHYQGNLNLLRRLVSEKNAALLLMFDKNKSSTIHQDHETDEAFSEYMEIQQKYMNELIPQREIYRMKIPILKEPQNAERRGAARVSKTTSERYHQSKIR